MPQATTTWNSVGEMSSELEAHEKALKQEINELRDKPLPTTAASVVN
jgi:hypothetical protein